MWLDIKPSSGVPIYVQISTQIRQAVASGALSSGERLPSVRELARQLTINPNTAAKAYDELERKGIVAKRRGRGTFVREDCQPASREAAWEGIDPMIRQLVVQALWADMTEPELLRRVKMKYREVKNDG